MQGSTFLQSYWWLCIISLIGLIIGLKFFKESKHGQALIDWFLVSSPLVSRVSNKIYTNEMLRILGNLIESKVPLLDALEVTRGAIRNRYFRNFIDKIIIHVEHGGKFAQPFATYPYILDSVKQMVSTGEETGNLPKTMLRLTRFYDIEVEQELKRFATMIEPVALVVMGAVVGLIVSSVILPMFKLAHAVG
jgi:type II secretory pathway component PulF